MNNKSGQSNAETFRSPIKTSQNTMQKISIKTRPVQAEKEVLSNAPLSPVSAESKTQFNSKTQMSEASKFLTDYDDLGKFLNEFLSTSPNFNVISAIGPQGSGKSTVLSMLAGNNARQMYREYFFRPVSREANELSRHQTIKLEIFITNHHIFIDCQPTHSFSILENSLRSSRFDDSARLTDTMKLTSLLISVSHTILVCSEAFIDLNLIKTIRTAELIRPCLKSFDPKLSSQKKTNLVFIQTKAQRIDFSPAIRLEREQILRGMLADSKWLQVSKFDNKVLVPLIEFRVRKDQLHNETSSDNRNYELSDIDLLDDDDISTLEFDESIAKLRTDLLKNRESFSETIGAIDEKKWLELTQEVVKNETFLYGLRSFQQLASEFNSTNDSISSNMFNFSNLKNIKNP